MNNEEAPRCPECGQYEHATHCQYYTQTYHAQLLSEKDAEIQRLTTTIQSLRRVIENADTEALNKLEEALKQIQHLKSSRVKDIEDVWDACEESMSANMKAVFMNNHWVADWNETEVEKDKSTYLSQFDETIKK